MAAESKSKLDMRIVILIGMAVSIFFRGDLGFILMGLGILLGDKVAITGRRTLSGRMAKVVGAIFVVGGILAYLIGGVTVLIVTLVLAIVVGFIGLRIEEEPVVEGG